VKKKRNKQEERKYIDV